MATNFAKKWHTPTYVALAFINGMGYRYLNPANNPTSEMHLANVVKITNVVPTLRQRHH